MGRPKLYAHDGKTLSLGEWSKRTGIPRNTLYQRMYAGWPLGLALSEPVRKPGWSSDGNSAVHKKRTKKENKGRGGVKPGAPNWKAIRCPTCRAEKSEHCWYWKNGKQVKTQPHRKRYKNAPIQDDKCLVPKDWKRRLAKVRQEKEAKLAKESALIPGVHGMHEEGMTGKSIAKALGITPAEVGKLLGQTTGNRRDGIKPGSVEVTRKAVTRPPMGTEGHGAIGFRGSFKPCGGGWHVSRFPREGDLSFETVTRFREDGRRLD